MRPSRTLLLALIASAALAGEPVLPGPDEADQAPNPEARRPGAPAEHPGGAGEDDADWPEWRGARAEGSAPAALVPAPAALELAWSAALGSGYASVSVAGGLAVTLAAHPDGDYAVALDAATGEEVWRRRVGDTFLGRAGSDDGSSATPAIGRAGVYALLQDGTLVGLDRATGEPLWRRDLVRDHGAERHTYGFSSAPRLAGELLIVLGGDAEGSAVVALDAASGEVRWTAGSGAVEHQNPAVVTLGGVTQVVAPTEREVAGYSLEDGAPLWSFTFERGSHSGDVTPIDGERLLVTRWDGNTLVRVTRQGDRFAAEELWSTDAFKRTYAVPVRHGDHLYGFSGRFLACVSLETGERVWRSRPPGGEGLIGVGDQLAIVSPEGELVLAAASPEGYRETARLPLFDRRRVMTPASAAAGMLFVRDLERIAAVRVRAGAEPDRLAADAPAAEGPAADAPTADAPTAGPGFERLLARLGPEPGRPGAVDELLAEIGETPWVDGDRVHFLYRGDVDDLAIVGDMTGGHAELPLRRVPGTDLFHRAFAAPRDDRWEYRFKIFDESVLDPLNPRTVETPAGERSVVEFGDPWGAAGEEPCRDCRPWRPVSRTLTAGGPDSEDGAAGDAESATEYRLEVRLPPEYDEPGERRFPVVIWLQGSEAREFGSIPELLDGLPAGGIEPFVAVFVALPQHYIWQPFRDRFGRALSELVLPELERSFRIRPDPASRALVVQGWGIESGLLWALETGAVGRVAAQSPMMGPHYAERDAAPRARDARPLAVHLGWGRFDERNRDWGLDVPAQSAELARALEAAGHRVTTHESPGGANWTRWRHQTPAMLRALFPPAAAGSASSPGSQGSPR